MTVRKWLCVIAAASVVAAGVMGGGCARQSGSTVSTTSATTSPGQPTNKARVEIIDFSMKPATVNVTKGGTVTWTNKNSTDHTVTADNGDFSSGTLSPGKTFARVFAKTGSYGYHCKIHPDITGQVVVK